MSYWNEQIEIMDRKGLENLKRKKIAYTLQYADEYSPFYHKLFRESNIDITDIKTEDDLIKRIPIVTKDDIIANQPPHSDAFNFLSAPPTYRRSRHYTSGTSGEPKICFRTADDWNFSAEACCRGYRAASVGESDLVLNMLPYGINVSGLASTNGFMLNGTEVIPAGVSEYPSKIELINLHKPNVLFGMPSYVDRLSRKLEIKGQSADKLCIEKILFVGEGSTREKRKKISDSFGCETYQFYASNEGDVMAHECHEHKGLHVMEDLNLITAIDLNTKEVLGSSEEGGDLLTTLVEPNTYKGMLMINYHHGDLIKNLKDEPCECGRTHKKIGDEIKRIDDVIEVGPVKVSPSEFESILNKPKYRKHFTGEFEIEKCFDNNEKIHTLKLKIDANGHIKENYKEIIDNLKNDIFQKNYPLSVITQNDGIATFEIEIVPYGELNVYKPGKPKRII